MKQKRWENTNEIINTHFWLEFFFFKKSFFWCLSICGRNEMVCKHLTCGESIYPHCRNRSAFQRPHYIKRISVVRWHVVHTFNCSTSRQRQLDLCEFENPAWPTEQVLASQGYIVRPRQLNIEPTTGHRWSCHCCVRSGVAWRHRKQKKQKRDYRHWLSNWTGCFRHQWAGTVVTECLQRGRGSLGLYGRLQKYNSWGYIQASSFSLLELLVQARTFYL